MNLHHFYHIYADGNWREPVTEHIKALKMTGLLENLTSLHIGFVGSRPNQLAAHQCLQENGLVYKIAAESETGWEQVTQGPMYEFCQDNDGLVLYAHTKGAHDGNDVNVRWRRSMTYWNVIEWKQAVERLQTHGAYGCHWIQPLLSMTEHIYGNWMFAGTFYWLHADMLKGFRPPPLTHRHEAEGYIGYLYAEKPFKVYDPTPYFPNQGPFKDDWL